MTSLLEITDAYACLQTWIRQIAFPNDSTENGFEDMREALEVRIKRRGKVKLELLQT